MIKGTEIKNVLEKQKSELHFWQFLKRKNIDSRLERLKCLGENEYYWKDTWAKVEWFDPDKEVRNKIKSKEIVDGNECVGKCLNCKIGAIFEIDPIEKISQCNHCLTEFKLS